MQDDEAATQLAHQAPHREGDVAFRLRVVEGPDKGRTLRLERAMPPALVGTSASVQLALTDPTVSRRHLSLDAAATFLALTDLGSTNGTFVNGLRVQSVSLSGGELVQVGASTLLVEAVTDAPLAELSRATNLGRVIGGSLAMRRLYDMLASLAKSDVVVCIEGETGTGKELVAETLHELGPRQQGPFVVFDCPALEGRGEAVLFGDEGPDGVVPGLFEQAHGGTLLVDEISSLEPSLQGKLNRAIERGEFVRVGGATWNRADVRIVATTRLNLDREVLEGRFRDDLLHRLTVGRVALPPLRQRKGDISTLASYFWKRLGLDDEPLSAKCLAQWEAYDWPGNVRELVNAVERRAALGDTEEGERIDPTRAASHESAGDLGERVLAMDLSLAQARAIIVEDFERRYVEQVFAAQGNNVTRAAAASGIARRYFQILRNRYLPSR